MSSKMIKSARRVFEVLEYFNAGRETATVMDIARALDYPQSSTSELLHCLVSLGYLTYSSPRAYRPSARVAVLGARDHRPLFGRDSLLGTLDALAQSSGERLVLAGMVGNTVQEIYTTSATQPAHVPGTWPLLRSALGRLFLSAQPDVTVFKLAHRLNAEAEPCHRVARADLAAALSKIRCQRYVAECDQPATGEGVVALLLPRAEIEEQLALAMTGDAANRPEEWPRLLTLLRAAVARHRGAGPVAVAPPRLVWPRDLPRDASFDHAPPRAQAARYAARA